MDSSLNNHSSFHSNLQHHGTSHARNNFSHNKDELLGHAIIDLYMSLKQKLKHYSTGKVGLNEA